MGIRTQLGVRLLGKAEHEARAGSTGDRFTIQNPGLSLVGRSSGRPTQGSFLAQGFQPERWRELAVALERHLIDNEVVRVESSPFGMRYIVQGPLVGPSGHAVLVRSVWFLEVGEKALRLVTAYPLRE